MGVDDNYFAPIQETNTPIGVSNPENTDWWTTWTPTPASYSNYTPVGSTIEEQIPFIPTVEAFPNTTPVFNDTGYQTVSNEGIVSWSQPGGVYVPVDFQSLDWSSINKIPDTQSVLQTVSSEILRTRPVPSATTTSNLDSHPKLSDFQGKAATTQTDLFGSFSFLGLTGITAFLVFWMLMQKK